MLFLPLLLLSIATASLAATCYEGTGKIANINQAWELREQMCGHNACANSDAARGNNHYCSLFKYFNGNSYVQLERNDPSGNYKNCWDAFENILQQCMNNPNGSGFKNGFANGNWKVGNEWYWIHFNNGATSSSNGKKYVYGPNKYCVGAGPGGGNMCVDIKKGCYVEVGITNTLPAVKCGNPPRRRRYSIEEMQTNE